MYKLIWGLSSCDLSAPPASGRWSMGKPPLLSIIDHMLLFVNIISFKDVRSIYSVTVQFTECRAAPKQPRGFLIHPSALVRARLNLFEALVNLFTELVDPAPDFKCTFSVLGCKLFIPLHALTSLFPRGAVEIRRRYQPI